MPKQERQDNNKEADEKDIQINLEKNSSLAEFTKRPLPTQDEVKEFEEYVDKFEANQDAESALNNADFNNEEYQEEIEESLSEIYQDDKGKIVDVKKLFVKKKRGFFFWIFSLLFFIGIFGAAAYAAYSYFYFKSGSDATAVEFFLKGKNEVMAGEEFFCVIDYKNSNIVSIKNIRIEVSFPENFIFLDSFPQSAAEKNNVWELGSIAPKQSGKIEIKGRMLGCGGQTEIVSAHLSYMPENFSSEFKKDASLAIAIKGIGLDFDFDYLSSALVGEEEEIIIRFEAEENNYINSFRLTFEPRENIKIIGLSQKALAKDGSKNSDKGNLAKLSEVRPGVWDIEEVLDEEKVIPIIFSFAEKLSDKQEVVLIFEKMAAENKYFKFFEKKIEFEVMKSDLNLALIINGSRADQGVDLGQTLNYSIVYSNQGETEMKDVVIMAILESDFLDWGTLSDSLNGKKRSNTITWSKEEVSGFEALARREEGIIDFSIKTVGKEDIVDIGGKPCQIKSYAQYSVGQMEDSPEQAETDDNLSNTIINKINSNLEFKEEVKYFNDDNMPVGTGKHPPHVNETTSYKVYWSLSNSLHELKDLQVSTILPAYVSFANKENVSVGNIHHMDGENKVVWRVGRLPASAGEINAEFSISITPDKEDQNKIMALLSGSSAEAVDVETESEIRQDAKAKTTRLEDDEFVSGDGIVE